MKTNNEVFIGEIKQHLSDATLPRPKRTKRLARIIGAGGGLTGLAKGLIVMTATAMLISTMVGTYLVSQKDNIELVGRLSYDLWVDGVPIGGDSLAMTPDVFTGDNLSWGETETFIHSFYSPPHNGNFSVVINQSWQTWLYPVEIPEHEFFGYRMYCLDELDNEITSFEVMTGEPAREIKFCHSLDAHFASTNSKLPYNLSLSVSEYNAPPIVFNDTISVGYHASATIDVCLNDIDPEGDPLHIVGFQPDPHGQINLVKLNDHEMQVTNDYGSSGSFLCWVDIGDSSGHVVRGWLAITLKA